MERKINSIFKPDFSNELNVLRNITSFKTWSYICFLLALLWLLIILFLFVTNSPLLGIKERGLFRISLWISAIMLLVITGFLARRLHSRDEIYLQPIELSITVKKITSSFYITGIALFIILFIAGLFFFKPYSEVMVDDAYISLRYAVNLVEHKSWGFNPGDWNNTATSPMNVLCLSIFYIITGDGIKAALTLHSLWAAIASIGLLYIFYSYTKNYKSIWLASVLGLYLSPLYLSTIGLETMQFVSLFIICLICILNGFEVASGFFIGLLVLSRVEAVLFALIAFIYIHLLKKSRIKFVMSLILTLVPWFVFSYWHFQSLLPDTLKIKMILYGWSHKSFLNGFSIYLKDDLNFGKQTIFWFALSFITIFRFKYGKHKLLINIILIYTFFHYIIYSLLIVPPFHWYYSNLVFCSIFIGSISFDYIIDKTERFRKLVLCIIWLVLITFLFDKSYFSKKELPPLYTNWALPSEYKSIGNWFNENTEKDAVIWSVEVGMLGYYSKRRILDSSGIGSKDIFNMIYSGKTVKKIIEEDLAKEKHPYILDALKASQLIKINKKEFKIIKIIKTHAPIFGNTSFLIYSMKKSSQD